jgi:hypothetical protein
MYEKKHEKLLPVDAFIQRILRSVSIAAAIVAVALGIGILGYHITEDLPWLDSLLNASMILGGMGPVDGLHTVAGKLFASFYALFSGLVFVGAASVLLAPLLHRLMHHFHIEKS